MKENILNVDVFIIGAGPAGAIAAAKLVQNNVSVKVIEKQSFPRFVIGESLLPRCNQLLSEANMLDSVKKAHFQFKGGVAFQTEHQLEYFHFKDNLGESFNSSYQVKRELFDHTLIKDAEQKGADVEFESEVIDYDPDSNLVTVRNIHNEIQYYQAKKVIDASGYGRVLPRLLNLDSKPKLALRRATFCRVKGDIRPNDDTEGYIFVDIHGNNDAWIWNIPFNDGITSVGIVCTEEYFQSYGMNDNDFWDHIIATTPTAQKRYQTAQKVNSVNSLSGYSAAVTKLFGENFVLVGNASEFLDPVFSSGVTLALESGSVAADLILREWAGETIDWQRDYEDYMMRGINVFREFVETWYNGDLQTVFFAPHKDERIKQSITSVLSGYVWNQDNFFVKRSPHAVDTLLQVIGQTPA